MSIKPILFNTDMVRAILEGRKTVTRRVIKPQPDEKHSYLLGFVTDSTDKRDVGFFGFGLNEFAGSIQYAKPPYRPGDILYVRETFSELFPDEQSNEVCGYMYKVDTLENYNKRYPNGGNYTWCGKWKPSIHMPKEAARIFLKVTNVRVERLQDISVEDAKKEGAFHSCGMCGHWIGYCDKNIALARDCAIDKISPEFPKLWDATVKKSERDCYGWNADPWVWVIEFEVCDKPELLEQEC